jgi:hypothetical protein
VPEVQTDPVTGLLQQWMRGDEKTVAYAARIWLRREMQRFAA